MSKELPIPPEDKEGIFEQMAQLFIDTYEELVAAMEVMKHMGIDPDNRKERVNELQMRYTGIIEKYQSKMFEQPEQDNKEHRLYYRWATKPSDQPYEGR